MSLACPIGPEGNLLEPSAKQCHRLWLENPILSMSDLENIKGTCIRDWRTTVVDMTCSINATCMSEEIDRICKQVKKLIVALFIWKWRIIVPVFFLWEDNYLKAFKMNLKIHHFLKQIIRRVLTKVLEVSCTYMI